MALERVTIRGFGDEVSVASGYSDLIMVTNRSRVMFISFAGKVGEVATARALFRSRNRVHLENTTVHCEEVTFGDEPRRRWSRRYYLSPSGYRVITTRMGNKAHMLAISLSAFNKESPFLLFSHPDGFEEALARYMKERTPVPFLPEWIPWIHRCLNQRFKIEELRMLGTDEMTSRYRGWLVTTTDDELQQLVSEGLNLGYISMGEWDTNAEPIAQESRDQLTSYVKQYRQELADIITNKYTPLFNPETDKVDKLILDSKKELLLAQQHAVQGVLEVWKRSNWAIIVGEMGTGKGVMGPIAAYAASKAAYDDSEGKPFRALVVCPGHLVHKWEREVKSTVPNAKVKILRDFKDLVKIDPKVRPTVPEYVIVSRSRVKLTYMERLGAVHFPRRDVYRCPDCGVYLPDRWNMTRKSQRNSKCPECGTKLWQADNSRTRRYSMADWILKRMKGWLDYVILDEIHEDKAGSSEQGAAMGKLAGAAPKVLGLTGTLLGGYAEDLFYLLFRLQPKKMRAMGFGYGSVGAFNERYGVVEKTRRRQNHGPRLRNSRTKFQSRRLPGVSPMIFPVFLMDNTVFLTLSDLGYDLPPYEEHVALVEMDDELRDAYKQVENALRGALGGSRAYGAMSRATLGTYISALLAYPDHAYLERPITEIDEETEEERVIFNPPVLDESIVRPKEEELIWHIQEELSQGRRVWVYAHYTGGYGALDRLERVIKAAGINVRVLKSNHPKQEDREEWIKKQVAEGAEVIISHPRLVATGLDLYDFPTLIFYQTGLSIYQLRQASRRSWRIGQTKPVKVIYMAYRNTLQEDLLRLMGSKLEAATAIEGKFSEEGLRAMSDSADMTSMLARALVEGLHGVDSAEAIWKRQNELSKQQRAKFAERTKIKVRTLGELLEAGVIRASRRTKTAPAGQLCFDFFDLEPAEKAS